MREITFDVNRVIADELRRHIQKISYGKFASSPRVYRPLDTVLFLALADIRALKIQLRTNIAVLSVIDENNSRHSLAQIGVKI